MSPNLRARSRRLLPPAGRSCRRSITGYDGVAMIQMCQPQLTTVEQDVSRIGREAARKLVHLIEQPRTTLPEIISVPCRLIAGKTVAKLG